MQYTILPDHNPSAEDESVLMRGLSSHAWIAREQDLMQGFAFFIRDENGKVVGGVKGSTFYGCLYTDLLWVHNDLRGQSWGTQLMALAETIGRERNCTFATVNTMDWEALPFYQKLGYQVEFIREGFRHNSKLYFLRKTI
ncbi:MAG: GNAT family N-acetyltransferase [Chlamydiales bacterium]|nr:GNAT family N-acetyltransferase [Chlamydiales bacterium]